MFDVEPQIASSLEFAASWTPEEMLDSVWRLETLLRNSGDPRFEADAAPGATLVGAIERGRLNRLASVLARALEGDRAQAEASSRERDRASARRVQRSLMGASLPASCGVTVDVSYVPAFDVSGDFYEFADLGSGLVGGAIGDVSGRGISAALIMSRVSADVRRALCLRTSPSRVLESVNSTLTYLESETFVTAASVHVDSVVRRLTVASAGHVPVMVRRASGEVITSAQPSGTPLGMMACDYADETIDLEPLDIVLLMTDGLLDALDRPDDPLGEHEFLRLVATAPTTRVVSARACSSVRGGRTAAGRSTT